MKAAHCTGCTATRRRVTHPAIKLFVLSAALFFCLPATAAPQPMAREGSATETLANLKRDILKLNQEGNALQEQLIYPGVHRISVFLSVEEDSGMQLETLVLRVDGRRIASTSYTRNQVAALSRGGIQQVFIGQLAPGRHAITADLTGKGALGKRVKRSAELALNQSQGSLILELQVSPRHNNIQRGLGFRRWPSSLRADMRYGTALYHYYMGDQLAALTELELARREGGILSYGIDPLLLQSAASLTLGLEQETRRLLDQITAAKLPDSARNPICLHRCRMTRQNISLQIMNQAWFHLGKSHYRRGDWTSAEELLQRVQASEDSPMTQEIMAMRTNIAIRRGRLDEAEALSSNSHLAGPWRAYIHFNMGTAYLRQQDAGRGLTHLDRLIELPASGEEHRTLRDRALTVAAYTRMELGDYDAAETYFRQVRRDSLVVQQALYGYGISQASRSRFQQALTPWLTLTSQAPLEPSVQQVLLAVPQAYIELGSTAAAMAAYARADRVLSAEIQRNIELSASARRTSARSLLNSQPGSALSKEMPGLIEAISEPEFDAYSGEFRDLQLLQATLDFWESEFSRYRGMLTEGKPADVSASSTDRQQRKELRPASSSVPQTRTAVTQSARINPTSPALLELPRPRQQKPRLRRANGETIEQPGLASQLQNLEELQRELRQSIQLAEHRIEKNVQALLLEQLEQQQTRLSRYLLHSRLAQAGTGAGS